MTLILDTSPAIALIDRNDPQQPTVEAGLRSERGELVIPAPVLAEIDYFARQRLGRDASRDFLRDVAERRFEVVCLDPFEYAMILDYDQRYADFDVGLADLSVVALAHRYSTRRIMTFDERHFRALRPIDGGTFTILPADEPAAN